MPGGAGCVVGVQLCMYAVSCIRRKASGQQYPAVSQPVPGKEHFLVPAVHLLTDLDGDVSAGAVPDLADQYVYDRHSGVLPCT